MPLSIAQMFEQRHKIAAELAELDQMIEAEVLRLARKEEYKILTGTVKSDGVHIEEIDEMPDFSIFKPTTYRNSKKNTIWHIRATTAITADTRATRAECTDT